MTPEKPRLVELERGSLPLRLTWRMFLLFLIPAIIGVIEIQFAVDSWNVIYPFIKERLDFLTPAFADGQQFVGDFTITFICLLIWIYKPHFRKTVVAYLIALIIASSISSVIKITTNRARPQWGVRMQADNNMDSVEDFLSKHPNKILKLEPADYWLWLSDESPLRVDAGKILGAREIPLDRPDISESEDADGTAQKPYWYRPGYDNDLNRITVSDYNSFPSGHATSAFLLAAYLTLLFPRARLLFYAAALACAAARIRFRRHYPSDVICGGALGWFVGMVVFSWAWPLQFGEKVVALVDRVIAFIRPGSRKSDQA